MSASTLRADIAKILGWTYIEEDEPIWYAGMWVERDGKAAHPTKTLDAILALFTTVLGELLDEQQSYITDVHPQSEQRSEQAIPVSKLDELERKWGLK